MCSTCPRRKASSTSCSSSQRSRATTSSTISGSGDGRIPMTAAKVYGARGVGIDIDPERIREANANAQAAGVSGRVTFLTQDLFTTDISEATVVTLFLTPSLNIKLLPKLNKELRPGTRVVSHRWEMKDVAGREYKPVPEARRGQQCLRLDDSNSVDRDAVARRPHDAGARRAVVHARTLVLISSRRSSWLSAGAPQAQAPTRTPD